MEGRNPVTEPEDRMPPRRDPASEQSRAVPERQDPAPPKTQPVARRDLELIIRRAAELHMSEADRSELIDESELLRIGAELGLSERHVRTALYELPLASEERGLDRILGPASVRLDETMSGEPRELRGRVLHELTSREYLRFIRQDGPIAVFEPAPDFISAIARALRWPPARAYLCRAPRLSVAARPLEPGLSHLHLELDFADRRRSTFRRGVALGGIGGAGLAAAAGAITFEALGATPPGMVSGAVAASLAGAASFAAAVGTGIGLARSRFRRRVAAARTELKLFTRRLERPPAPGATLSRGRGRRAAVQATDQPAADSDSRTDDR